MLNKLKELIEQWTRAEIMARHAPFSNFEAANYFDIKIQKENEIRELLFNTADLIILGIEWKILKDKATQEIEDKKQVKENLKQQFLQLQKALAEMEKENASS